MHILIINIKISKMIHSEHFVVVVVAHKQKMNQKSAMRDLSLW